MPFLRIVIVFMSLYEKEKEEKEEEKVKHQLSYCQKKK